MKLKLPGQSLQINLHHDFEQTAPIISAQQCYTYGRGATEFCLRAYVDENKWVVGAQLKSGAGFKAKSTERISVYVDSVTSFRKCSIFYISMGLCISCEFHL